MYFFYLVINLLFFNIIISINLVLLIIIFNLHTINLSWIPKNNLFFKCFCSKIMEFCKYNINNLNFIMEFFK